MSLNRRVERMHAAARAEQKETWQDLYQSWYDHLTPRAPSVIKGPPAAEPCRVDERMAEIMGVFGEDIEEWWAWFFELKATAEAAEENVSLLPGDVPAAPAEPEGLWHYLKEKSEQSPEKLEARPWRAASASWPSPALSGNTKSNTEADEPETTHPQPRKAAGARALL